MKKRKLDRITIATFCQNPYDLYLALPLSIPKNRVLETAIKYLRNRGKGYLDRGYFTIVNRKVEKTDFDTYDLLDHPNMKFDYSYNKWTYYYCWAVKIEFVENGQKLFRKKVIKYKRMGHKRFEKMQQRKTEESINQLIDESLKEEE